MYSVLRYVMCMYYDVFVMFFFFKQKTAYEMRISDWSSDVCSSDLAIKHHPPFGKLAALDEIQGHRFAVAAVDAFRVIVVIVADIARSPIAGGQEVEIMVVRQAVGKGLRPAGRIGGVAGRGPQIGAPEPAAAAEIGRAACRERVGQEGKVQGV